VPIFIIWQQFEQPLVSAFKHLFVLVVRIRVKQHVVHIHIKTHTTHNIDGVGEAPRFGIIGDTKHRIEKHNAKMDECSK
jgi:hypothetical protein